MRYAILADLPKAFMYEYDSPHIREESRTRRNAAPRFGCILAYYFHAQKGLIGIENTG